MDAHLLVYKGVVNFDGERGRPRKFLRDANVQAKIKTIPLIIGMRLAYGFICNKMANVDAPCT